MKAFRFSIIIALLLTSLTCRNSDVPVEQVAAGEGYLLLDSDGQKLRIPVKEMEIYLVDPGYQDKYPEKFEISSTDLHLVGTFPMTLHVGYGEHFEKMVDRTVEIAASGNPSRRAEIDSHITIPGRTRTYVEGGTFQVTEVIKGKILRGNISLTLEGGKNLIGTFVFKATTWG